MFIKQFRYSRDNLGYLVFSDTQGVVIDGGNPDEILGFAKARGIDIKYVTNTHFHQDHTCGNTGLLEKKSTAQFIDCRMVSQGQVIALNGESLEILLTPGHTENDVCFKADDFLVTGDTLFNGTVGNCFSGDLGRFFTSLKTLMALPKETKIYAGHDYVQESMKMAASIKENNPDIDAYLQKYDPLLVVSTLDDELRVNPYLRFNAPSMTAGLEKRNMPSTTEKQRFFSIMEIY